MNEEDDGSFNIERCDACSILLDDTDGANAMVLICNIGAIDWP
jgi:hypothetical protein